MVTFDELIQVDCTMHILTARTFNNSPLLRGYLKDAKVLSIWLSLLFSVFFCSTSSAYTCDVTIQNISDKEALEQLRQLSSNSERPNVIVKQSRAYMIDTKAQCNELQATLQILDTVEPKLAFHIYQGPRPPRNTTYKTQGSRTINTRSTQHITKLMLQLGEQVKVELESNNSPRQTHYLGPQASPGPVRNGGDIVLNRPKLNQQAKPHSHSRPNTIIDSQAAMYYQLLLLPLPSNIVGTARLRLATKLSSSTEENTSNERSDHKKHLMRNTADIARRWPSANAELTLKPGHWYQLGEVLLPIKETLKKPQKSATRASTKITTAQRQAKVLRRTYISFQGQLPD